MLGGYENLVQIPSMPVFDTTMMQADIAAAREIYNLAREDYKDFINKYDDFYSLSDVDNANYYNMTRGAAENLMNKYGGDLLRSAEGRAAIQNMIAGVDRGAIANMKASAETMKEFVKNRDALAAQGKYDPRWDAFYSNMTDPEHWDSRKGIWTRTAPSELQTLHDLTKEEFERMEKTELLGTKKAPDGVIYDIYGVGQATQANALEAVRQKIKNTPGAQMYKDNIRQQIDNDPQYVGLSNAQKDKLAEEQFDKLLLREQAQYLQTRDVVSEKYKEDRQDRRTRMTIDASGLKNKNDGYYPIRDAAVSLMRTVARKYQTADGKSAKYSDAFVLMIEDNHLFANGKLNISGIMKAASQPFSTSLYAKLNGDRPKFGDANSNNIDTQMCSRLLTKEEAFNGAYYPDANGEILTYTAEPNGDMIRKNIQWGIDNHSGWDNAFNTNKYENIPSGQGSRIVCLPKNDGLVHTYLEITVEYPDPEIKNASIKQLKDGDGNPMTDSNGNSVTAIHRPKKRKTMYEEIDYNFYEDEHGDLQVDEATSARGRLDEYNTSVFNGYQKSTKAGYPGK